MTTRIAVLASGGGSNLQAILDHLDALQSQRGGEVALVVSDRHDAGALQRARGRGIATKVISYDGALDPLFVEHDIGLVALAGYLRFVPDAITQRYAGRIVNVHPSLLPAFGGKGMYGMKVHQAAIDAGVRVSGATVHFVDFQYDHGPIIAQWPVPVYPLDDARTLAARVLTVEHLLYPRVVDALAAGRIRLTGGNRVSGSVTWKGTNEEQLFAIASSGSGALVEGMDGLLPR